MSAFLAFWVAAAAADAPVVVELRGANVRSNEPILIHFVGDDASTVNIEVSDSGRKPDQVAGDGSWTGRGELEGLGFELRLEAGTRSLPKGRAEWKTDGDRRLLLVVRGGELDAVASIETETSLAAEAEARREPWGAPWFWLVAALVGGVAAAEAWGARRPIIGLQRILTSELLDGSRFPRGAVRVASVSEVAPPLIRELARARTVILVGAAQVLDAAPGSVLRLRGDDPERLSGVVAARRKEPLAIVVVTTNGPGDWLEIAAELPADVPVFVLLPAGDLPPDLEIVDGRPAWVS